MNRVLVAGIGNIFLGDDGFGCEVIRQLLQRRLPDNVDVVDYGIRGLDLGYTLMDGGYGDVILVDTAQRGGEPGALYVIEPDIEAAEQATPEIAPHAMDPKKVLTFVATLGEARPRVLLVACEPAWLGGDDGHMGLTEPVDAAVEAAVDEILRLLETESGSASGLTIPVDQPKSEIASGGIA